MASVIFKSTLLNNWMPKNKASVDAGALEVATDIERRAVMLAPRETGALVNSGNIVKLGNAVYRITFGSSRVPYAKRRHYENKRNPQTLRYLEKAGDSVARGNISKYFRSTQ